MSPDEPGVCRRRSNVERELHVPRALARLDQTVVLLGVSTFYATPPLERPADPVFVNGVVEVRDAFAPEPLKVALGRIESDEGRCRGSDRFAPRPIDLDLDLLVHGDSISTVPLLLHPNVATRRFVAVPLLELAPELTLPGCGVPLATIVETLPPWPMEPAAGLTLLLRRRFTNGRRPG